jgi:hypothetical protein
LNLILKVQKGPSTALAIVELFSTIQYKNSPIQKLGHNPRILQLDLSQDCLNYSRSMVRKWIPGKPRREDRGSRLSYALPAELLTPQGHYVRQFALKSVDKSIQTIVHKTFIPKVGDMPGKHHTLYVGTSSTAWQTTLSSQSKLFTSNPITYLCGNSLSQSEASPILDKTKPSQFRPHRRSYGSAPEHVSTSRPLRSSGPPSKTESSLNTTPNLSRAKRMFMHGLEPWTLCGLHDEMLGIRSSN